ncbi:MAG: hypothetical protein GAK40_01342 [Burkholderia plantarii]|nr:MAG: hypothetical protein GAK40_01342 [Burkholderia plantarii]
MWLRGKIFQDLLRVVADYVGGAAHQVPADTLAALHPERFAT